MELLRKRICYLLARNGSLEIDSLLSPLIHKVDEIPETLLKEVISFLEQQQVDLYEQLRGKIAPPPSVAQGAQWVLENCADYFKLEHLSKSYPCNL
jgi:succinate dehydrogenase flavin-adding protein (antitoxin of CptAB toxin-antitoxin module)